MSSFGRKLRQIREERGRSLSEIADATKIRRTYLEALETDDFDAFPGKAYGKFFLRAYADAVGFDPEPLMAEYDRAILGVDAEPVAPEPESQTSASSSHAWKVKLAESRRQAGETRESREVARADPEPEPEPVSETDPSEDPLSTENFEAAVEAPAQNPVANPIATLAKSPPEAPAKPPVDVRIETPVATPGETPVESPESNHEKPDGAGDAGRRWVLLAVGIVLVALVSFALIQGRRGAEAPTDTASTEISDTNETRPIAHAETVSSSEDRASTQSRPSSEPMPRPEPGSDSPSASKAIPPTNAALEAAPEAPTPSAAPVADSVLTVAEHGVGTAIQNRRLVGSDDRFEEGSGVVFFTQVLGGSPGMKIRHVWRRDGSAVQAIELNVGASHWRTHSRKTLWGIGDWSVEAQDADGRVLARAEFRCVAQGALSDS